MLALCCITAGRAAGQDTNEIRQVRLLLEEKLDDAAAGYEVDLGELAATYGRAVEALMGKLQAAGDLDAVLAVKQEVDRFTAEGAPTETSEAVPPAVLRLQRQYLSAKARAIDQATLDTSRRIAALTTQYLAALDAREKRCTRDGRLDDALLWRAEMQRVRQDSRVTGAEFDLAVREANRNTTVREATERIEAGREAVRRAAEEQRNVLRAKTAAVDPGREETGAEIEEQENLVGNGDFESGESRWRTGRGISVIPEPGTGAAPNHVLEVELDDLRVRILEQDLRVDKRSSALEVTLQVRYPDAPPDGTPVLYRVRCQERRASAWHIDEKPIADYWATRTFRIMRAEPRGSEVSLSIEFPAGPGRVWVDDIVVHGM